MTENEIRQKVVATVKKYLGCRESDGSHKKFIDRYNSFSPLPRNHKMTYTAAWCATFVSAIAIECGLTGIMPVECSCNYMINLYKKLGHWQENDACIPKIGDVIFYDWDDGKDFATTDNIGRAEHVGIVTGVSDGVITVIEGNKDNAVGYRKIKVNGRYIRGFGLPDYAKLATPEVKPAPKPITKKCPYPEPKTALRYGDRGNGVRWAQWYLNQHGAKLKIDGSFGPATKTAVLAFQKKSKLTQDGIVGPKTRTALKKKVTK